MPANHSNMRLLDFERVRFRKRLCDLAGDLEIRRQFVGDEALRQGYQPARIAYERGLTGGRASPQFIEHALNFCEPPARAARALIPQPHAQKLQPPEYIQIQQSVRVVQAAVAARPPRLPPAIKGAHHHLRGMDQVIMQIPNRARPESRAPMRFFQLASETSRAPGEAILEIARQ